MKIEIKTKTDIYDWQEKAVKKLLPIKVGALYMEMGTGKTRTALEMIKRRIEAGKLKHVLWLCPCSVRENLKEDIQKHVDGVFAFIAIYGIESLSSSVRLYEKLMNFVKADTTMLIVDESNLVKNFKACRTRRIVALSQFCKYRLILNGTPISKNEADLFAQWYILDWRILGYRSFWSFASNHLEYDPNIKGKITRILNTDYLINKIAPYSYQISRSDCFTLPNKKHYEIEYSLTAEQRDHYTDVTNYFINKIDEQKPSTIYRMFSAAQAIISGLYVKEVNEHIITSPMFKNPIDNPRIKELIYVLNNYIDNSAQVIIFAKYTHEIKTILQILPDSIAFYGGLSHRERTANLEKFKNGAVKYLVGNKVCAGLGLNLQFCHNVIFYSNDWDWATRVQAEDRVYRLGQNHEVKIYDIIAVRTLDNKILKCLERKENLSDTLKYGLKQANLKIFQHWLRGEILDGENIPK